MSDYCDSKCVHEDKVAAARTTMPASRDLLACAEFFKVFGDQTRLAILTALRGGELCVCDIARAVGATDSAASHQLSILRRSGLVEPRREGKTVFYRLSDAHVETIVDYAFEHLEEGRPS